MNKYVVSIAALVVLAGAGCKSAEPTQNQAEVPTQNAPVAEQQTQPAVNEPNTTGQADTGTQVKTFTMAEVQAANNEDKCWTVVRGKVYDLTPFTPKHPGGDKAILALCGKDGTSAFERKHGGQPQQEMALTSMEIGTLQQ